MEENEKTVSETLPEETEKAITENLPEENDTPSVPKPTNFDPEANIPLCVYGPPEWFSPKPLNSDEKTGIGADPSLLNGMESKDFTPANTDKPQSPNGKFCECCGYPRKPEYKFCVNCGARLK